MASLVKLFTFTVFKNITTLPCETQSFCFAVRKRNNTTKWTKCFNQAPDIWRRHSTSSAFCWLSHAAMLVVPSTRRSTLGDRAFPVASGTCVEQPAVVCQECTVADDVPSRAEDCTFPVVVWQWLGDRDCTTQYNVVCPRLLTVGDSVVFVCFSF